MSVSSSQRLTKCPKCLTPNNVTKAKAGSKVRCTKCGSMITVRDAGMSSGAVAATPPPSRRDDPRAGRSSGVHSRGGGRASGVHGRGAARGRGSYVEEEEAPQERGRGRPKGEKVETMPLIILGVFVAGFLGFLLFLVFSNKKSPQTAESGTDKPKKSEPVLAVPQPENKPADPKSWVPDLPGDTLKKDPEPEKGGGTDGSGSGTGGGGDGDGGGGSPREDHMQVDAGLRAEIEGLLAKWQDMPDPAIAKEEETIVAKGIAAIPCLIMAVGSGDEWVSKYATRVLKKITGHEYSWSPGMSQSDRESQRDKWIRWWNDNAPSYKAGVGTGQIDRKDDATSKMLDEALAGYAKADSDERMTREKRLVRQGKEIIPGLIGKLTHEIKDIAAGASRMLTVLTKEDFGEFQPDYPQPHQQKWQEWWEKNKETFEINY